MATAPRFEVIRRAWDKPCTTEEDSFIVSSYRGRRFNLCLPRPSFFLLRWMLGQRVPPSRRPIAVGMARTRFGSTEYEDVFDRRWMTELPGILAGKVARGFSCVVDSYVRLGQ